MRRRATHGDKKGYCCGVALLKESEESRRGEREREGGKFSSSCDCADLLQVHKAPQKGVGEARQRSRANDATKRAEQKLHKIKANIFLEARREWHSATAGQRGERKERMEGGEG